MAQSVFLETVTDHT